MEGMGSQVYNLYQKLRGQGLAVKFEVWCDVSGMEFFTLSHNQTSPALPPSVQTSAACPKSYADAMRSVDAKKSKDARRYDFKHVIYEVYAFITHKINEKFMKYDFFSLS